MRYGTCTAWCCIKLIDFDPERRATLPARDSVDCGAQPAVGQVGEQEAGWQGTGVCCHTCSSGRACGGLGHAQACARRGDAWAHLGLCNTTGRTKKLIMWCRTEKSTFSKGWFVMPANALSFWRPRMLMRLAQHVATMHV